MNILKNKYFWTVLSIVAVVITFIAIVPKPIDMDLQKIGNGKNSVVFIYDPNLSASNQQAIEINKAREVIGEEVNFLIAKRGDPNSDSFRERYQARSVELLYFDGQGELVDRKFSIIKAEEFLSTLKAK